LCLHIALEFVDVVSAGLPATLYVVLAGAVGRQSEVFGRVGRAPWIPNELGWARILDACRTESLRNWLMVAMAYDGAVRREELVQIEIDDLEPELAELGRLLEDDQLFHQIKADLRRRRPRTMETSIVHACRRDPAAAGRAALIRLVMPEVYDAVTGAGWALTVRSESLSRMLLMETSRISTAVSISASVTVSGGAMRKQLAWGPLRTMFIDRPRRRHSAVTSAPSALAGVRLARSSTSSSPTSSPRPRTSPTCSWRACNSWSRSSKYVPRCRACSTSCSSAITSRTARPAAAGSGSATCKVTCTKPVATQSASIALLVMVAASGMPPPSVFGTAAKSGT